MHPDLRTYRADLHIHTALSPCASAEMTPPAVVRAALEAGIDMIAIADHNTAGNVAAVQQAAEAAGGALIVLPGMEITTVEEVHVLALFPETTAAERIAIQLKEMLPEADGHYYSFFGEQPLLDAEGAEVGAETVALAYATPLDLDQTIEFIHAAGGLAIAAHVDRKAFSVFSQLGFFPADAGFDAVEVSRRVDATAPLPEQVAALGLAVTSASDGHFLEDIGRACTVFRVTAPTFDEVALALALAGDRRVTRA